MQKYRKIIYFAGFLFSIPVALTSYVNSSFLKSYMSEDVVSLLYVVASILTILGMLIMPKILTKLGNRKSTLIFSLLGLVSLALLALGNGPLALAFGFVLFFVSSNFVFTTLDVFVEDFSKDSSVGKLRGLYLVALNLAWVLSQTVSGTILERTSYQGLYLVGGIFVLLFSLIFVFSMRKFVDPEYKKVPVLSTLKVFFQNKNLAKIYLINFILKFFFVWMIIYTPIYLHENIGFSWQTIGPIFTIMLLPFVLLTYPLGRLSDKIGEKEMLLVGFLVMAVSTFIIPSITSKSFLVWALVLCATRVGAATVEIMSESYFFKSVNEENADEIALFRNTSPVSFIFAPILAVVALKFIPSFSYLFSILGVILLLGFYITLRIKDVK